MIRAWLVGTGLGTFTLQKASSHVMPPRAINIVVPSDGLGMQRAGVGDDDDLWGRKRWKKKTKQSGQ